MLEFEGNWGEGCKNQQVILNPLGISSPQETKVREIVIRGDYPSDSIHYGEGKYWSCAFVEATFKDLGLEFGREIEIPDSLREYREKCFKGVGKHPGFLSVFDAGKTIEVKLAT